MRYYLVYYQLVKWLSLWEEEVAKKREETEDLQKKLQEASAMQACFSPLMRSTVWRPQKAKFRFKTTTNMNSNYGLMERISVF